MRKLLSSSAVIAVGLMFSCHASEDAGGNTSADNSEVRIDSSNINLPTDADSVHSIEHGTPDPEKLDSIKREKEKEKKKG